MMGQPRQTRNTYSVEDDLDEEERHGAGYIDEPVGRSTHECESTGTREY